MCGLVGMAGNITRNMEQAFRTMLYVDVIRGEHSTGVAGVGKYSGRVSVVKALGPPTTLMGMDVFRKDITNVPNKVLIGHNRFATRGAINVDNAHPFQAGHITGAHNGTLVNKWELPDQAKYGTDSEALYNLIANEGVEKGVSAACGAYALTFYDAREETINLIRNDQRTLYYALTEKEDAIIWASEKWMIEVSCKRHDVKIGSTYLLKEDTLLTMQVLRESLSNVSVKTIKGKPPVVCTKSVAWSRGKSTTPVKKHLNLKYVGRKTTGSSTFLLFNAENPEDIPGIEEIMAYDSTGRTTYEMGTRFNAQVNLYEKCGYVVLATMTRLPEGKVIVLPRKEEKTYIDHKGHKIPHHEFKQRYGYCCWCSSDIEPEDDGTVLLSNGDALCKHCMKDDEIRQYAGA